MNSKPELRHQAFHLFIALLCTAILTTYASATGPSTARPSSLCDHVGKRSFEKHTGREQSSCLETCAAPELLPPNDDPCGAVLLEPIFGCLPRTYPMTEATVTDSTATGVIGIPPPPCGTAPGRDIWFTVVVPVNGALIFDMEATALSDAAMALYTAQGSCAAGTLDLQPITGGCATEGSSYNVNMPALQATDLTPGDTLYLRVWQESGDSGDALICVRRTDEPSLNCRYELRLSDLQGDGWNGGYVRICVGALCTNYTIDGSTGFVNFFGNVGQTVAVIYFPAGGFQNQISYQILAYTGGLIYESPLGPTAGANTAFWINTSCNVPPAPPSDCVGYVQLCGGSGVPYFYSLAGGPGFYTDLDETNRGCLSQGDITSGYWIAFIICGADTFGMTLEPSSSVADLNWAIWEFSLGSAFCPPPGPPLRCSNAIPIDGNWITGMRAEASDSSEDASGDGWLAPIANETLTQYVLYIQNPTDAISTVEINVDSPLLYNCAFDCITTEIVSPTQEERTLQPNPASDHIELISDGPGPLHWEIRDGKGMLCGQGTEGPALRIPVAHLSPGLYLFRTTAPDGRVRAYRWVKE